MSDDGTGLLRELFAAHTDEIVDAGTAWLRREAAGDLASRPYEETRGLVLESVQVYAAAVFAGELGPRDAFIDKITTLRSTMRFRPSTLLRGFFAVRHGVERLVEQAQGGVAALARLDAVYLDAAAHTADLYVSKLNEVLDAARGELLRREKLAALGGLVAGVAHEINTPLGVAVTAVSVAQDRVDELTRAFESGALRKQDLRHGLAQASEAGAMALGNLRRASDLVRSFKQIAVDQASEVRRELDLGEYVREVVASLGPLYRATPHRVVVEARAPLRVLVHAGAVSQICTNLLHNALAHAFPKGHVGTVRIWVDRVDAGQAEIGCADDGVGMAPEVVRRIYEPFFTTLRGRGGSGLGMHVVHNLVTGVLGGTITATSTPCAGARFVVRFPVEEVP